MGDLPFLASNQVVRMEIRNNYRIVFSLDDGLTGEEILLENVLEYEMRVDGELITGSLKYSHVRHVAYLNLSYEQNGLQVNCMFKGFPNDQQLGNIISALNRRRIEEKKRV